MDDFAGFPVAPLEFTKQGAVFDGGQRDALLGAIHDPAVTDLLVLSHGWNNDKAEATELYKTFCSSLAACLADHPAPAERRVVAAAVYWPSKRFADEDLIPGGGAASLGDDTGPPDVPTAALQAKLAGLRDVFDNATEADLDKASRLIEGMVADPAKAVAFARLVRGFLPPQSSDPRDDASDVFLRLPEDDLLAKFRMPVRQAGPSGGGRATGMLDAPPSVPGLGDLFVGVKAAAWRLLNYATYYQMKERAGLVGAGLNGVLATVRQRRPTLRIHLVGHSFGARVVTAAVDGPKAVAPSSLCLLQGAFSHNGFAGQFDGTHDGFFRAVVTGRKVAGPIVATYTVNDKAVGLAYPFASRFAHDNSSAFGDKDDPFGGLGRNGAVRMRPDEVAMLKLLPRGQRYAFAAGKVHNLQADAFVKNHGDITSPAVANAVRWAMLPG